MVATTTKHKQINLVVNLMVAYPYSNRYVYETVAIIFGKLLCKMNCYLIDILSGLSKTI